MDSLLMTSRRLILRQTRVEDAAALHQAYRDVDLMRWWSCAPHADLAETIAYLTPWVVNPTWRGWTITLAADERVIGTLAATERRAGVSEIGYLLVRSAWGQGYAREAVARLLDRLIHEEGMRRICADVDPDNAASIALLEDLGFRREGVLRDEWETHIGVRDSLILGLVAAEWTGGRARSS